MVLIIVTVVCQIVSLHLYDLFLPFCRRISHLGLNLLMLSYIYFFQILSKN